MCKVQKFGIRCNEESDDVEGRSIWGLASSGIWRRVARFVLYDVSEERYSFTFISCVQRFFLKINKWRCQRSKTQTLVCKVPHEATTSDLAGFRFTPSVGDCSQSKVLISLYRWAPSLNAITELILRRCWQRNKAFGAQCALGCIYCRFPAPIS